MLREVRYTTSLVSSISSRSVYWGTDASWTDHGNVSVCSEAREAGFWFYCSVVFRDCYFFRSWEKKQLYYTLPALVPLGIWATGFGRLSYLGTVVAVTGWLSMGVGLGSLGKPWLPLEWTAPRHVLAKPPSYQNWPFEALTSSLEDNDGEILVFSESDIFYEGFVVLTLRELFPNRKIRSVILRSSRCKRTVGFV